MLQQQLAAGNYVPSLPSSLQYFGVKALYLQFTKTQKKIQTRECLGR